jgi:hypothetical protein
LLELRRLASHTAAMENQAERFEISCSVEDVTTRGFVMRRDIRRGERLSRAGKIFGMFFLAALLTVFIPLLHFVLPPLALLIGGALAIVEYLSVGEVVAGEIECPNCKRKIVFQRQAEEWPRTQRCEGCAFSLKFEREI